MARGKKRRDPIPKNFKSLEEFQEFWDTHSTADYDDLMHDVEFKVNLKRRIVLVALEPKLAKDISSCARTQGISSETLINLWLKEKLAEAIKGS